MTGTMTLWQMLYAALCRHMLLSAFTAYIIYINLACVLLYVQMFCLHQIRLNCTHKPNALTDWHVCLLVSLVQCSEMLPAKKVNALQQQNYVTFCLTLLQFQIQSKKQRLKIDKGVISLFSSVLFFLVSAGLHLSITSLIWDSTVRFSV